MNLSNDLLTQFAKITKDDEKVKTETIVYGTTVEQDGTMYVKLDGSTLLTPVIATADTKSGERVTVMIKNHTATITGNISSPAARVDDVKEVASETGKIAELELALNDKVGKTQFETEQNRIDTLVEDTELIAQAVEENKNDIDNLQAALNDKVGKTQFETEQNRIDTLVEDTELIVESLTELQNDVEKLSVNYIAECGTNDIWSYKKWSNSDVELWGTYEVTNKECITEFGLMYRTDGIDPPVFPFQVNNVSLVASYESDSYGGILWAATSATTEKPPTYYLVCLESTTITSGKINLHVFGKLTS